MEQAIFSYFTTLCQLLLLVASNELWNTNRVLVGNLKIKRQIWRPKRGWEDNIKMYLKEVKLEGLNRINVARDWDKWRAVVNVVMLLETGQLNVHIIVL
jgi:hypothetical protein